MFVNTVSKTLVLDKIFTFHELMVILHQYTHIDYLFNSTASYQSKPLYEKSSSCFLLSKWPAF